MTLASGSAFGAYEIVAILGSGGMGDVYRARDTRLGREVALKVLPISRQDDPAFRARFEREARALAALSNPHIAAIYDVIDLGDRRAIVMELVTGSTLAELLAQGPVPLRRAIDYAIDISDALSVAHAAGIVHRDLKPANVVATTAGPAKVLDFGLAKSAAVSPAVASEQSTVAMTEAHVILGTLGYLSPEQASAQPVDGRSDIFSLGVVLHELISGQRAFHGDSTAELLSAVLRDQPPLLRTLDAAVPRSVERIVARCLEKAPRRRYQSVDDLKAALEDLREDLGATDAAGPAGGHAPDAPRSRRLRRAGVYGAAVLGVGVVAFMASAARRPPAIVSATYAPLIAEAARVGVPAWSPDGRTLAFLQTVDGRGQVMLRGASAARSTQLTRETADGISLFWSPDGSRVYFTRASDHNLVSVGLGGGEPLLIATAVPENAAVRTPVPAGGLKATITPDGRTLVYTRSDSGGVRLWTKDLPSGQTRPFDVTDLPKPLANVQALAFSPDGRRIGLIASATALNDARGVWMIAWPSGSAVLLFPDAPYLASNPALSWLPDSRRFVMNGYPLHGGTSRLLLADVGTGTLRPLTGGMDDEGKPSVTPDGTRIAFTSERLGLDLVRFPVGGGPPEPVVATSRNESHPDISLSGMIAYVTDAGGAPEVRVQPSGDAWPHVIGGAGGPDQDRAAQPFNVRLSPDGQRAAVELYGSDHLIWIFPTAGGPPVRLDSDTTDQHGPSWSPDGNWIAYRRLRDGAWELVKTPLGGGAVVRLDDAVPGGGPTDWSPSGQWIAQGLSDGLHLVAASGGSGRTLEGLRSGAFRFSHDGSRLMAVRRGANGRWELAIWDVAGGRELRSIDLALASTAGVQGMALSPDDSSVVVGAGTAMSDIWLLEEFEPAQPAWPRWFR